MHAASALVLLWQPPGVGGAVLPRVCQRKGNRTFSGRGGAQPAAPSYVPRTVAVAAASYTGAAGATPAAAGYNGSAGQRLGGVGRSFGG